MAGFRVFNEFAGWQKGSFGLCVAGSEERLFFFPGKLIVNHKTLKRYQLVVRKRNKAFLKIWSLSTPVEDSRKGEYPASFSMEALKEPHCRISFIYPEVCVDDSNFISLLKSPIYRKRVKCVVVDAAHLIKEW